jgi:hypothetical protein
MSLKATLNDAIAAEMRLRILEALSDQIDGQLSIVMLKRVLDAHGFRRDRDWIATQLMKLEGLGAVTVATPGGVMIARVEAPGRDHLEERSVLAGVLRPHEVE